MLGSEHAIAMALRSAYWSLHRSTDTLLGSMGVTAHQYVILELLADHGPSKQSELVQLASSDPNTIRAMVVTMCKQDLVERVKHPTDGRAWLVRLTEHAKSILPSLRLRSKSIRDQSTCNMSPADQLKFLELLETFHASLAEMPKPHITPKANSLC